MTDGHYYLRIIFSTFLVNLQVADNSLKKKLQPATDTLFRSPQSVHPAARFFVSAKIVRRLRGLESLSAK